MKKFLSLMLAMLMLVLPTLSLAETGFVDQATANGRRAETTITIHDLNTQLLTMLGAPAETLTLVTDVLNVVALSSYTQEGEAGLSLNMQNTPVLTLNFAAEGETVLLGSNLLGNKAVALTGKEQVKATLERLLTAYRDELGVTEADIQQVLSAFDAEIDTTQVTEALDMVNELDFSPFTALAISWAGKIKAESVTEQPNDCDAADTVTTLTLTAEDASQLMAALVEFIDKNPSIGQSFITGFEESGLKWEESKETVAQLPIFPEGIELVAYTASDDLVKLTLSAPLAGALFGESAESLPIYVIYTLKDGLSNTTVNFANMMQVTVAYQLVEEATQAVSALSIVMSIMQDGTAISFGLNASTEETTDGTDAYSKTDLTAQLLGMDIITLTVETQTCAPKAAALSANNAIDLSSVSDAEFETWCQAVPTNATNALTQGIFLLPQSVLTLLLNQQN